MTYFEDDLRRWAEGELPLDELAAYHRGSDVRGVAALHGWLTHIAIEPVPDPEQSWMRIKDQLASGIRERRVARGLRLPRRLVAAIAAVMLMGTAAYAVSPEAVKGAAGGVWHGIGSMFQGNGGSPGSPATATTRHEQEDGDEGPPQGATNGDETPGGTGPGNDEGTDESGGGEGSSGGGDETGDEGDGGGSDEGSEDEGEGSDEGGEGDPQEQDGGGEPQQDEPEQD